jgi:hypothetical protein
MGKYEIIACTIDSITLALLPPPARVVRLAIYCSERGVRDDKGNLIGVPIDDWSTHPDYTRIRDSFAKQFPNDRLIMQQFSHEQPGLNSNFLNSMDMAGFLNGDLNIIFAHTGRMMPYIANVVQTRSDQNDPRKYYLDALNRNVTHLVTVFACHLYDYFDDNREDLTRLQVDISCRNSVTLENVLTYITQTLPAIRRQPGK